MTSPTAFSLRSINPIIEISDNSFAVVPENIPMVATDAYTRISVPTCKLSLL